jgi:hypothetical protein
VRRALIFFPVALAAASPAAARHAPECHFYHHWAFHTAQRCNPDGTWRVRVAQYVPPEMREKAKRDLDGFLSHFPQKGPPPSKEALAPVDIPLPQLLWAPNDGANDTRWKLLLLGKLREKNGD